MSILRAVRFLSAPQLLLGVALALGLAACGKDVEPIESEVALTGRFSEPFALGSVELGTASAVDLMGFGWHVDDQLAAEAQWVWTSSDKATLLLPSGNSEVAQLELEVRAPAFLPYAFTLGVELNGTLLGTFDVPAEPTNLITDIPAGTLRHGLNRLTLISSHVESPSEHGKGNDTRKLGVQVRRIGLGGDDGNGVTTRIQIPNGGVLRGRVTGDLVVQDLTSLAALTNQTGSFQVDLSDEAGREVFVTAFGQLDELAMAGAWRPANLVLIIVDTLRADIIDQVDTPHLDALMDEGLQFEHAFSHAPMTLPSHTALFSSRYPHVSGVVNNGQKVPQDLPLLSDWMVRSGYEARAVASLGTLWLGRPQISLDRGFETFQHARGDDAIGAESVPLMESVIDDLSPDEPFFLFAHFADPHEPYRDSASSPNPGTITLNDEPFATFEPRDGPHINRQLELPAGTHRFVIESPGTTLKLRTLHVWDDGPWKGWVPVDFKEGALGKPADRIVAEFTLEDAETIDFEIWLADKLEPRDVPGRYRQEVARADAAVGDVIAKLKQRGLWDNSLVIFTSDHGEAIGENGRIGHVQTLFDDQIHVPLIIKPPSGEPWGALRDALKDRRGDIVRHIDLVPTILDILNLAPLPDQMGTSLLVDKERMALSETHKPEANRDSYACRDAEYKLIYYPETQHFQMYAVQSDPREQRDVFATKGDERLEWQELLRTVAARWDQFGTIEVDESETARLEAMGYL